MKWDVNNLRGLIHADRECAGWLNNTDIVKAVRITCRYIRYGR
jgi:hypothetical protein